MSHRLTLGQKLADKLATGMGSWTFLIIQSSILVTWVCYNVFHLEPFDPYPFILLNLMLSFQAAYAAPIIMMANNRQEQIDRKRSIDIYKLEKTHHDNLSTLVEHLDKHFHEVKGRLSILEDKLNNS